MFTGIDYVFVSNLEPEVVEIELTKLFEKIWGNPIIEVCERQHDSVELFISKNVEMGIHQDEHGFTLDKNNEGCVFYGMRKFFFLQGDSDAIYWNKPEKLKRKAPYKVNISLLNVWEYTLVLPAEIEESVFCKSIYDGFLSILKGN
jgi:hypothetical protein